MSNRSALLAFIGLAALLGTACGEINHDGDMSGTGRDEGGSGGGSAGVGGGGAGTGGGAAGVGGAGGSVSPVDAAVSPGPTDARTVDAAAGPGDAPPVSADGATGSKMSFFVTSETSATGNLGGIAMADAKCQRLGAAAGAGGKTWKAYLSTAAENARMRIGQGPWFNFKGEMIAANLVQLHEENGMKNNLSHPTALTDKGATVPGRTRPTGVANEHDFLTGSTMSGMVKTGSTCSDWTSAQGESWVGHGDRMGVQTDPVVAMSWNSVHAGQCANTAPGGGAGRFYCFATD